MEPQDNYKYDLIDDYLNGNLSESELAEFNHQLEQDPSFAQEVAEQRLIVNQLQAHHRRNILKKQMNLFHQEIEQEESYQRTLPQPIKVIHLWRKYAPSVAVAASVVLIAVFTSVFTLHTLDHVRSLKKQQSSYYKALRRDLNIVKQKQDKIAQEQKQDDKIQEVKQYGATAFVISPYGYLVTNYHVIKNADSIYIEIHHKDQPMRLQVKEVMRNIKADLAILRIVDSSFIGFAELPYAFRNDEAELGEEVYTLAYPRRDMVYGEGSISAKSGYQEDTTTYQISIPVNPGNSGGPLLDEQGNLLGIVSGKHTHMDGATFAIKAKYLEEMIQQLNTDMIAQIPLNIPKKSSINYLKRPEQIKKLKDFVYVVQVYDSKGL
ncbi:MAG: trypsin-like peptidase domain-containing protein [Bacteroidia bacterium]|nr:trypsin-like peptidase domain-containing protein [Bacteroidia bacterium]